MANSLGTRFWKIDTASSTALCTDRRTVLRMRFVPAAVGDDVVVTDTAGETFFEVVNADIAGNIGSQSFDVGANGWSTVGLIVSTLTAGAILYIWFKNS